MHTDDTFELLNGIVYKKPRNSLLHGRVTMHLAGLLMEYERATPGASGLSNISLILDSENEAQVDIAFVIQPEFKGNTSIVDGYVTGFPELAIEIADKAGYVDLNARSKALAFVGEYIVVCLQRRELHYFDIDGDVVSYDIGSKPIWKSYQFPGLYIDFDAVVSNNNERSISVLHEGLVDPQRESWLSMLKFPRLRPH
jgi:Uma2 family endonuclease